MGCDIHLLIEKRNFHGQPKDTWEKIEIDERILPDDRYYKLFAFLADVRNYDETPLDPQFAGRGWPEDCSEKYSETDVTFYGDHSFTYAYLDEILKAPWKESGLDDCYFIIFCEYVLPKIVDWCGSLSKKQERNIRVVMGFDN